MDIELESLRSRELEQNILGNIINNISNLLEVKSNKITEKDFYYEDHKEIYKAIMKVFKEKNNIDLVLLLEFLNQNKLIDKCGSFSYVTSLSTESISAGNIVNHIEILKGYSRRRNILDISKYIVANISNDPLVLHQEINNMLVENLGNGGIETCDKQAEEYLRILESRLIGENVAVKTGLRKLDYYIDGLASSDLVTIFAFSGVGKTTLMCQMVVNLIRQKKKSIVFSLEMPKEQIWDRLLSNLTNIEYSKIKHGRMDDSELNSIIKFSDLISSNKSLLVLEDNNLTDIVSKVQLESMKNNVDVIFIDYVNLITTPTRYKTEHDQVRECTRALKELAKNIRKPIVILAQAKQTVAEKVTNSNVDVYQKLNDSDIHGGASIFRDSDKVIGMYRNTDLDQTAGRRALESKGLLDYNSKSAEYNPSCVNLLIRKCRSGEKATLSFGWDPKHYKINNLEN
ncbi:MAG: replicative DNA helicase [Clostridium celatum]|nr:replicative DNA helicase [Clostridium celatum]